MKKLFYPNPDIESQFRVQVLDVHKEFTKTKYSLVMKLFEDFLGALRACALIVIFYIGIWVLFKVLSRGMSLATGHSLKNKNISEQRKETLKSMILQEVKDCD